MWARTKLLYLSHRNEGVLHLIWAQSSRVARSFLCAVIFFLVGFWGVVSFSGLPVPVVMTETGAPGQFHLEAYGMGDVLPGDLGDARFNRYILENYYLKLTGRAQSFLHAPFFYPWLNTINFSDTHWGSGIFYAGFRALGSSPETAFSAWFALGYILNYFCAYFALRFLGLESLGAAAGAFLFSFCMPMSAQEGRAQLVHRYYVPLAVCSFHRFLKTRHPVLITLTMLLVSLQLLTTFYMGVFLVYLLTAYAVVSIYLEKSPKNRAFGSRLTSALLPYKPASIPAGVISVLLLVGAIAGALLFALPYMEVRSLYGFGHRWTEIQSMLPRIESYFLADRSLIWSSRSAVFADVPMRHEQQMFLGLVPLAAIACALLYPPFLKSHPIARRMLYAVAIVLSVTLSLSGASLYWAMTLLPGISAIRGVARIILVLVFPVAIIMGQVIDAIWARHSERFNWKVLALVGCLVLVAENTLIIRDVTTREAWHSRILNLEQRVGSRLSADSVLVVASSPKEPYWMTELDAMLLAQQKGIATLNGFSGNFPPGWKPMQSCQDVADVISAGQTFRDRHGSPGFSIDVSKLVLVGFDDCAPILSNNVPAGT